MDRQALDPYYQGDDVTLHLGDSLDVVSTLPDGSVDCIVTSPPYYGLRDYGQEGQYGQEKTVEEYVQTLVALFRECRRVLADDGTFWLNLGDSYGKKKRLLMVPARVAIALQDDGWTLRNDIVWHKTSAVPESVTDRVSRKHERIFMFSKSPKYWYDLDAIRTEYSDRVKARQNYAARDIEANGWSEASGRGDRNPARGILGFGHKGLNPKGKNPGDVWSIAPRPFRGAHFAPFPQDIPERCVKAGCRPGGTVLDPFSGSATTGMVALELGRKYVGIDINPEYHDLALATRLARREAA